MCVLLLLPQMLDWANEFGGVFKFSLGFQWVVVVSDPVIAVEVGPGRAGRRTSKGYCNCSLDTFLWMSSRPCTEAPSVGRTPTTATVAWHSFNAARAVPNILCVFRCLQVLGRGPRSIPRKCIGYKFFDLVSGASGWFPGLRSSRLVT